MAQGLKTVGFIVVAAVCSSAAAGTQAQDAARGASILAEARKAVGGEDRLRSVRTLDVRGDFKRMIRETTIEGELQIRVERPDKLRRDEDLSPPGGGPAIVRTEVLSGNVVWDVNSGRGGFFVGRLGGGGPGERAGGGGGRGEPGRGAGRAPLDPAEIEQAQRRARQADLARFMLAWLLATDDPVAWIGTAEAPDGKADVLEITGTTGPAARLFLDQSSHLPLMITWQGNAPQLFLFGPRGGRGNDAPPAERPARPETATFRTTLGEYKTVNGLKLPHLMTRGVNNVTVEEWTIKNYRINPSFRQDVFSK